MRATYREEPCKTALNLVPRNKFGWTLNPYMGCVHRCTFCYVRGFERRAERPSGEDYGASIRVKTNVVGVLKRELARAVWKRERVAIGTATDPYQPAEAQYRLTRGCIVALSQYWTPISVITRGPLVVRDADVLADAGSRVDVSVAFSVGTLEDDIWRRTEPGTAPPRQRFRALRMLADAGITSGVSIAPILPGLTDTRGRLETVVRAARDAGASFIFCNPLHLQPGTREHFMESLARDWPELLPKYEGLYQRPYLREVDAQPLRAMVDRLRDDAGLGERAQSATPPESVHSLRQLPLL